MRLLVAITLFILSFNAFALAGNSLTWQKLALEEKVQRKFNQSLATLLKDNQYMVEVEADIAEPAGPNFGQSGHKSGPRVSDIAMAESRGDYIAFSKMGLEVPVLEKFLDEDRTKLMNLYRFNETYDLFKSISDINVTVYLSDKIPQDLLDIVKKVLQSSKLSVAGIKPTVKYESMTMEWIDPAIKKAEEDKKKAEEEAKKKQQAPKVEKKVAEEPKIWTKDWLEWASRWGNAVGLILASIIIGFIAISLFKQWKAYMEKFAAQMAPQPEKEKEEKSETENSGMAMAQAESSNQEEEVASAQGFERFQQCLEQNPEDATNMVRNWLNDSEDVSLLALRGVAQQASSEQMNKLMGGLNDNQRDKWKGQLGVHLSPAELTEANKFIFQEVVRSFLVPNKIKDGELLNLIMELTPKATCDFLNKNEQFVSLLLNLLSPSITGKVISEISEATADDWLLTASGFQMSKLDEQLPELKRALIEFREANLPSPFLHRIVALIPNSLPSKEGTLFRALAKSGNQDMLIEVAKKYFPAELVLDLPAPLIKDVIQSYPMAKRIDFLYSRSEDERNVLLDVLAEKGSPARDMLEMELENVARDPSREANISMKTEEIWHDFVKNSRAFLSKQGTYNSYAHKLIKEWSAKLGNKLKAIKGGRAA